jgi:integral membrane protein
VYLVWDQGAAGSNPATPTIISLKLAFCGLFLFKVIVVALNHFRNFLRRIFSEYLKSSQMNLQSVIGRLRVLAILEGISFLLFAVTMPLKYAMDIPQPNFIVGMAHGWLFIFYVVFCIQAISKYKWNFKIAGLSLIASLVPFGTFIADAKIFKPEALNLQ